MLCKWEIVLRLCNRRTQRGRDRRPFRPGEAAPPGPGSSLSPGLIWAQTPSTLTSPSPPSPAGGTEVAATCWMRLRSNVTPLWTACPCTKVVQNRSLPLVFVAGCRRGESFCALMMRPSPWWRSSSPLLSCRISHWRWSNAAIGTKTLDISVIMGMSRDTVPVWEAVAHVVTRLEELGHSSWSRM